MAPLFENRVAIVTGSGQGVGKATGLLLASHGAQVVFNDWVRFELAQKTADALGPDCAIAIKADMTTVEGARRLVEGALKQFRRIDILVNNIGADSAKSKDIDLTEDDWNRSMDVNLRTTFLGCRAAAPYMKAQRYGKIVSVASDSGRFRSYGASLGYIVAKAAVIGLARGLAQELGPYNITVNVVSPGNVLTEEAKIYVETDPQWAKIKAGLLKDVPMGRWTEPEEIAGAILFYASDLSSHVTGTTMSVNGGWYMIW